MFIRKKTLLGMLKEERQQGFEAGVVRGYGLGKIAGLADAKGLGYIIGQVQDQFERDLEEIMRRKGY